MFMIVLMMLPQTSNVTYSYKKMLISGCFYIVTRKMKKKIRYGVMPAGVHLLKLFKMDSLVKRQLPIQLHLQT